MNTETDFSLEFPISTDGGFKTLPDLVAFDLCKAYPMSQGNLLLHNTRTGDRAMVNADVFQALTSCIQFLTLNEHVENIIAANPGMSGQQADIRRVLKTMIDSGIMVSAKKLCDDLKMDIDRTASEAVSDKPVVVIITWERPEPLERLLNSIVANCKTARFHHVYVVDDSRNTSNKEKNRLLTESFAAQIEGSASYFGQDQQQTLLTALVERLPEHEQAIRFLCDQSRWRDLWSSGLARNIALLLSCGRKLVMVDDDTVCDVYTPPGVKSGISFSDEQREARFYSSEIEWASLRESLNPDPIDRHMQYLGLSFSQALGVLGEQHLKPSSFAHSTALQISDLRPDSRILMTECGSFGCPGTGVNTWLPFMPGDSLKHMMASEKTVSNALNLRMTWSGRSRAHFVTRPTMSQITGFDNRAQLPPYLPVFRGEDRLFGYMLDFIFPSSVSLDLPWAIPHLPIPERKWHNADRKFNLGDSFPWFFFKYTHMKKTECFSKSPEDRLAAISAWFNELATASASRLKATYVDELLADGAEQLQVLNEVRVLAESGPEAWLAYLDDGIERLNEDIDKASAGQFRLRGSPRDREDAELVAFWKSTWGGFADALDAWSDIRKAAADIFSD